MTKLKRGMKENTGYFSVYSPNCTLEKKAFR